MWNFSSVTCMIKNANQSILAQLHSFVNSRDCQKQDHNIAGQLEYLLLWGCNWHAYDQRQLGVLYWASGNGGVVGCSHFTLEREPTVRTGNSPLQSAFTFFGLCGKTYDENLWFNGVFLKWKERIQREWNRDLIFRSLIYDISACRGHISWVL